jgi:hypothetical protein
MVKKKLNGEIQIVRDFRIFIHGFSLVLPYVCFGEPRKNDSRHMTTDEETRGKEEGREATRNE